MKKLFTLLITVLMLCALSCTKIKLTDDIQGSANVSLNYVFYSHTNDITTKSTMTIGEQYKVFYTKYILSQQLTPRIYELIFTSLNTKLKTYINGKWSNKELINFPIGKYIVTGSSKPLKYASLGDTCSLIFQDTISVTTLTTNLTLKANYGCSLLLFDNTNIKSIATVDFGDIKPLLLKTEDFYHAFMVDTNEELTITRFDGSSFILMTNNYSFILGKYYYFADTGGSYILPQMTSN